MLQLRRQLRLVTYKIKCITLKVQIFQLNLEKNIDSTEVKELEEDKRTCMFCVNVIPKLQEQMSSHSEDPVEVN